MNSSANNSGVRPSRTATGDVAQTPAWPVLASLPRIGVERAPQRAAMFLDTAVDDAAEQTDDVSTLLVATQAAAPEEFEPFAMAPPADRGTIELRTFIDQPHLAVRGYDWPVADERRTGAAPIAAPSSTYRRIDAGSPRASDAPQAPSRPAEPVSLPLATRIFQLHAAAAPHAGIIMTLALAASVGLLCWFTMGRSHNATTYDRVLDVPGGWPAETATTPLPDGAADVSAAPNQFVSEFAWQATPTSEPATAPTEDNQPLSPPSAATPAAPKLELNEPTANPAEVAGAKDEAPAAKVAAAPAAVATTAAAAPAPAAPVEATTAAKSPEPITPTPHEHGFPTTPYGEFNYFAAPAPAPAPPTATTAGGAVADPPSVAVRPADASAASAANR